MKTIFTSCISLILGGAIVFGMQQYVLLQKLEGGQIAFTRNDVYSFKVDIQQNAPAQQQPSRELDGLIQEVSR